MENNNGSTVWARQTIESEVFFYKPDKWFKIWFYIVNRVSFQDTKLFKRGSAYIDYKEIGLKTGSTYGQVEKFVKWAKHEGMLETHKSTRGNIITVTNFAKYQDAIKLPKSKQKSKHYRSTIDAIVEEGKECKEIEKIKENFFIPPVLPPFDVLAKYMEEVCREKYLVSDDVKEYAAQFLNYHEASPPKNWKNAARTWIGKRAEWGNAKLDDERINPLPREKRWEIRSKYYKKWGKDLWRKKINSNEATAQMMCDYNPELYSQII